MKPRTFNQQTLSTPFCLGAIPQKLPRSLFKLLRQIIASFRTQHSNGSRKAAGITLEAPASLPTLSLVYTWARNHVGDQSRQVQLYCGKGSAALSFRMPFTGVTPQYGHLGSRRQPEGPRRTRRKDGQAPTGQSRGRSMASSCAERRWLPRLFQEAIWESPTILQSLSH